MTCPAFRRDIEKFDINIFQETHLGQGGLDQVGAVGGYEMVSVEREYLELLRKPYGGVAAVYRQGLGVRKNEVLTSADVLVLETDEIVIIAAYILPETSSWEPFAEESPADRLFDLMATFEDDSRLVLILGDLNARTGVASGTVDQLRLSEDVRVSTRGSALLHVCQQQGYTILNGLPSLGSGSGRYTSRGCSVVDYAIGNSVALRRTESLVVQEGSGGGLWKSDHAELVASLKLLRALPKVVRYTSDGRRIRKRKFRLPEETEVDKLVVRAVKSIASPDAKRRKLYGPVYIDGTPIQVYVDGSCFDPGTARARAGSGIFFGPRNAKNRALRVPGGQTNNRGEIFAILQALLACDAHTPVTIYSDSEWAINTLTEWVSKRADVAFKMPHGDIVSDVVWLIQSRPAAVALKKVKAHAGNAHNDGADALAKAGAGLSPVPPYVRLVRERETLGGCECAGCLACGEVVSDDKVTTDLVPANKRKSTIARPHVVHAAGVLTARSLQGVTLQQERRAAVFGAETWRQLWREVNSMRAPRAVRELLFPTSAMARAFFGRMNRASPAPPTFDLRQRSLNEALLRLLPASTQDSTVRQWFSRPFSLEEVAAAKETLRKRDGSAAGGDHITYKEVIEMDNDALLDLCNTCLESRALPTTWIRTVLVGLCKKGKGKEDPESYRTIGLESCLLKFMTLLIHDRLAEWAMEQNLLPPSQNGFRAGYRTNNNVFILEAAKAKARSLRKPLYVAYVDMTNAFPSTDHATLWLKLQKLGAGGRIFDWLRALYDEMEYVVHHGGEESDPFQSDMGILIGDTCSPILWALYLSDLPQWVDVGDGRVQLDDAVIGSLEQADDILLLSTTPDGLRRRLEGVAGWCRVNFMEINESKSVVMIFGAAPPDLPAFTVCGVPIRIVDEQVYIGFHVSSKKPSSTLYGHYAAKAATAERIAHQVWGLEQFLGGIPADSAVNFYNLLVEPHLTHGCDVVLDTSQDSLKPLVKVQLAYLRRLMSVGKRSATVTNWTELKILPLRYKRVLGSLENVLHIVAGSQDRWVYKAYTEMVHLDFRGKRSWISCLRHVLKFLPFPVSCPSHDEWHNKGRIERVIEDVRVGALRTIQAEFDRSKKLYLLHGRVEPSGEGKPPATVTLKLRDYLLVPNDKHRKALTRLLVSAHSMACEIYQYAKTDVPWHERVCRYGCTDVETPEHILLSCQASEELLALRRKFQSHLLRLCTTDELLQLMDLDLDPVEQLRYIVRIKSSLCALAEFVYGVELLLKLTPLERR